MNRFNGPDDPAEKKPKKEKQKPPSKDEDASPKL
jgi:hypothetical protein